MYYRPLLLISTASNKWFCASVVFLPRRVPNNVKKKFYADFLLHGVSNNVKKKILRRCLSIEDPAI